MRVSHCRRTPPAESTGLRYGTSEILVYGADGVFVERFCHEDLRGPRGLVFLADSGRHLLLVTAQSSDRVLVFTEHGDSVRQFSGGVLDGPTGMAIGPDGDLQMSSFDLDGEFRRTIRDGVIDGPQGLALDEDGDFTISSFYTGKVASFARDGERSGVLEEVGSDVVRSLAFLPIVDWQEVNFVRGDFNRDIAFDVSDRVGVLAITDAIDALAQALHRRPDARRTLAGTRRGPDR